MSEIKILPYIKIYDFGVYPHLIEDNKYFGCLLTKDTMQWYPLFITYFGNLREKGPAIHDINYTFGMWHQYPYMGRHRLDGPQMEYSNGEVEYWLFDKQYSYKEFLRKKKILCIE